MFSNILIPVDGSDNSHKAVEVGADIAKRYGARVTVLHIQRPGRGIAPELLDAFIAAKTAGTPEVDFLREHAREIADREAATVKAAGVAKVASAIESGDPAHCIVGFAKAHAVDLIVMGSMGAATWRASSSAASPTRSRSSPPAPASRCVEAESRRGALEPSGPRRLSSGGPFQSRENGDGSAALRPGRYRRPTVQPLLLARQDGAGAQGRGVRDHPDPVHRQGQAGV
jgi:nucleotide-binding universal stress UspA family protein